MKRIVLILLIVGIVISTMGCKKTDEKNSKETHLILETNDISEYLVSDDIIEFIYSLQFNSGSLPCLLNINNIVPLSKANRIDEIYACIKFKSESNQLYVIVKHENEKLSLLAGISSIILTDEWYEKSEFESIKKGMTLSEINSIDGTSDFKVQYAVKRNLEKESNHYCKDGYYTICWEFDSNGEQCVKSIEYNTNVIITKIINLGL